MLSKYVRERDKAFLSLNKKRILRFCRDWGIDVPQDETVFWCAVHKVVVNTNSATEDQKRRSYEWLKEHGFSPDIY